MPISSRVVLLIILLLATALRLTAFFDNHFHADEALFASWARLITIWRDPLLLAQPVDKPPLLFYLQALAYPMSGPVEWAARLPNTIASLLLVPLTAVFSWRLFHNILSALAAALLVALSPMAIQFSATAFTDPLLCALLIAAMLFVAGSPRPFLSGFCFGLAVLTKHQAWLFLPLLIGLAWLNDWRARQWKRLAAGLLPPLLLLFIWQIARSGTLDLWGSQLNNFGGLRAAWSWEVAPRLYAWADLWPLTLGSKSMLLLFLLSIPLIWFSHPKKSDAPALADRLITLFLLGYVALHWLLAVPVWDRYLLSLVPLAAIILGRGLALAVGWLRVRYPVPLFPAALLFLAMLVVMQMDAAVAARDGQFATGGQRNGDSGAWQVAGYMDDAPYGTVLYDHWYSWHWQYAFIDKGVYTSWFPHPAGLAADLQVFGNSEGDRFLVVPADDRALPVRRAVEEAGYALSQVLRTNSEPGMILYRVLPS